MTEVTVSVTAGAVERTPQAAARLSRLALGSVIIGILALLLSLATRLPSPSAAAIGFVIGLLALLKIRRSAGVLRGKLMRVSGCWSALPTWVSPCMRSWCCCNTNPRRRSRLSPER